MQLSYFFRKSNIHYLFNLYLVGTNGIGKVGIEIIADLSFSILLLAQAFHKGIYFDETLFTDFCSRYCIMSHLLISLDPARPCIHILSLTPPRSRTIDFVSPPPSYSQYFGCMLRINAIEANGLADCVPELLIRKIFDNVRGLESASVRFEQLVAHPSYIFSAVELRSMIDWSFSDSEAFTDHMAICSNDAIYILKSKFDSHPSYCIPLVYVRMELEDANANLLHISPLKKAFPIICFNHDATANASTYYSSSTWMEFDSKDIAIKWLDTVENSQIISAAAASSSTKL